MSIGEIHGDLSCEIEVNEAENHYVGTLRYRSYEVGEISGPSLDSVRTQFRATCTMIDKGGGMVRLGIIMLGYHNGIHEGDVLLVDGEVVGKWVSDDEEWCHFTANGDSGVTCSAPSPWMLHESIADYVSQRDDRTQ